MLAENDSNLIKLSSNRICKHYLISEKDKIYFTKKYKNSEDPIALQEMYINERLDLINHPNILKYYGSIYNKKEEISLKFELSKIGSLFDYLNLNLNLTFYDRIYFIRKNIILIIDALIAIHKQGIIHNDLKMENLLLFNKNNNLNNLSEISNLFIKVADFNNSKLYDARKKKTKNIFNLKLNLSSSTYCFEPISFKYDYWSLGIVLFQMLFNKNPFVYFSYPDFIESLKFQKFKLDEDYIKLDFPLLKDLIENLLTDDIDQRLHDGNVLDHPFFNNRICNVITVRSFNRNRILMKRNKIFQRKNKNSKKLKINKKYNNNDTPVTPINVYEKKIVFTSSRMKNRNSLKRKLFYLINN